MYWDTFLERFMKILNNKIYIYIFFGIGNGLSPKSMILQSKPNCILGDVFQNNFFGAVSNK